MTKVLVVEDNLTKFQMLEQAVERALVLTFGGASEEVRPETEQMVKQMVRHMGTVHEVVAATAAELAEFDVVLVDFGLQTGRYGQVGPIVDLELPSQDPGDPVGEDGAGTTWTTRPVELTTGIGVLLYLAQLTARQAYREARGTRAAPVLCTFGVQDENSATLAVAAAQSWFGYRWFPFRGDIDSMADQLASILDTFDGTHGYVRRHPVDHLLRYARRAAVALDSLLEYPSPALRNLSWLGPDGREPYLWLRGLSQQHCDDGPDAYRVRHSSRTADGQRATGLIAADAKCNPVAQLYDQVVEPLYVGLRAFHGAFGSSYVSDWAPTRAEYVESTPKKPNGKPEKDYRTEPVYTTLRAALAASAEFWTAEDVEAALGWHRAKVAEDARAAAGDETPVDAGPPAEQFGPDFRKSLVSDLRKEARFWSARKKK